MDGKITIKLRFGDDLRRISVSDLIEFDDLRQRVVQSFRFASNCQHPLLKYKDDEGDDISITCSEELVEAIRLSRDMRPPILHLHVFETKGVVPPVNTTKTANTTETTTITESQPQTTTTSSTTTTVVTTVQITENENDKQYPSLPVSEWDAPGKTTVFEFGPLVKLLPVLPKQQQPAATTTTPPAEEESKEYPKIPIEEWTTFIKEPIVHVTQVPSTIGASTQHYCTETTKDVERFVRRTVEDTKAYSKGDPLCTELSDQIKRECAQLARNTAELCAQFSKAPVDSAEQQEKAKANAAMLGSLALSTALQCQRLSEETRAMCTAYSDSAKSYTSESGDEEANRRSADEQEATTDADRAVLKSQVQSLSDAIKGDCDALSDATVKEGLLIAERMRKLIMGL